ncbi:MAG: hypothetical protein ACI4GZ_03320 [Ruminococcus sp.]
MNFKAKFKELTDTFKGLKNMTLGSLFKDIHKDVMCLVVLGGALLMLIGAFLPYNYSYFHGTHIGLASFMGWAGFLLTLATIFLGILRLKFWAGVVALLNFTFTGLYGIIIAVLPFSSVRIGFWFMFIGALITICAAVLDMFVITKDSSKAIEDKASAPTVTVDAEPVAQEKTAE